MHLISTRKEIEDIFDKISRKKRPIRLGFTGVPPDGIWADAIKLSDEIIDLDMPIASNPISEADKYLPKVCCATLRTIMANSILMKDLDWLILSSGIDKCDGARFIGMTLQKILNIPVILTENLNNKHRGNPVCESNLPLKDKFCKIVGDLIKPQETTVTPCKPEFGFWGVPPNDFDILDLFPPTTHVFGWARCIENRTPADHDLEETVNNSIPTVYFAQAFCPKNYMAYRLAKENNGLYVEADSKIDHSIMAKIEAFLYLTGKHKSL